jgi:hypothetical protein
VLLLIALLWYWVGSWADKIVRLRKDRTCEQRGSWLLLFIILCAAASSISSYVGGYTSYVLFGIAVWVVAAIGVKASMARNR